MKHKLSMVLRDSEAAPWVIEKIKKLEKELSDAYLEIIKLRPKAVFDRDVHTRAK